MLTTIAKQRTLFQAVSLLEVVMIDSTEPIVRDLTYAIEKCYIAISVLDNENGGEMLSAGDEK